MDVKIIDNTPEVVRKVKKANITTLSAAGAYIRGIARRSIKISQTPAPPGHQPHSRKGRLKDAIIFVVDNDAQILTVGVSYSAMGKLGGTHEHGGVEPPKVIASGCNWKMVLGGHGPIRESGGFLYFAKLTTAAQVAASIRLAQATVFGTVALKPQVVGVMQSNPRNYPPRPFMGPAFEVAKQRLPSFWEGTVK